MSIRIRLMALSLFASSAAFASIRAVAQKDRAGFWAKPGPSEKPVGALKKNSIVDVISKSPDGEWLRVKAYRPDKSAATGWVRAEDFEVENGGLQTVAADDEDNYWITRPRPMAPEYNPAQPEKKWSFGGSIGGFSNEDETVILLMGDVRYAWSNYVETILGLDVTFGTNTYVGYRLAQRLYAVLKTFKPYLHAGYRRFNMTKATSAAIELGTGFQVVTFGRDTYVELGTIYLLRTPFDEDAKNTFIFSGGLGKRF